MILYEFKISTMFLVTLFSLSLSIVLTLHFLVNHHLFLPALLATLFSFHKHFFKRYL